MQQRYEYRVISLREGLIGGAIKPGKVQDALNQHAKDGWRLKSLTTADVKGRLGPGSAEGLLATFERPVP